jgi:hypothetical protein
MIFAYKQRKSYRSTLIYSFAYITNSKKEGGGSGKYFSLKNFSAGEKV